MREAKIDRMSLADVFVETGRRPVDPKVVERLKESISKIGLMTPITVKIVDKYIDPVEGEIDKAPVLVSGRHRLEAVRGLGHKEIDCFVWDDPNSARMWEIAENLHRAELTAQERADHIAEWVELVGADKHGQVAQVSGGRGKEGGISAATRELGIERTNVRRSIKIASITPEAKEAAKEAGLDNNQSALLKVASAPPSQQVAAVTGISAKAIELRHKKKRRRRFSSRAVEEEPQHDRDLRMLRGVCEGACVSAQQAFFQEFETQRDLADRPEAARSIPVPGDDGEPGLEDDLYEDFENYRTAFLLRIDTARRMAVYAKGPVDHELIAATRAVAEAWSALAQKIAGGVSS
jgi:hypothetical protein